MATYLSAKKAGFKGTYDDWTEAGRPAGGTSSGGNSGNLTNLPTLTFKDRNGQTRTFDPNGTIQQKFYYTTGAGNQAVQRLEIVTGYLNNIDMMLDPNMSKSNTPYQTARGDVNIRSIQDVDWDKFDDPELAKKVIPAYIKSTQSVAQNLQKLSKDPQYQALRQQGGDAFRSYLSSAYQTAMSTGIKEGIDKSNLESNKTNTNIGDVAVTNNDPIYQADSYTKAYNQYRLDTGGSFSDFKAKYGTNDEWEAAKAGDSGNINKDEPPTGGKTDNQIGDVAVTNDGNTKDALSQLDDALKNGLIDQDTYNLFKTVVRNWDVNKELNMDNVLSEFDKISESTISPYYAEQADIFKKDLQSAVGNLQQSRAEELEAQNIQEKQRIEGAQGDLEARGLTTSSQAAKQLGTQSAFGGKIPFGGQIGEGLVQTQNRLISSGSQRGYQQAIDTLGRQAENVLGQNGLVPGFTSRGVTQGSLYEAEQKAKAGLLSNLAGQQNQLFDYQKPINFNFS